ncbi:hypothetical protein [Yinghuangia soli]|uniref:Secreted protein n=1 Tax=Yinghuangia soli TaxID=2908204 RepID=A0AA41U7C3_9ACTN|nr:hypothetical protein [Yinghuangia soli]MCF2531824.1 hypothetical protein [Yinghuangia soli]
MLRSKIGKAVGLLASAIALTAATQTSASAAAVSWGTSYPQLGNAKCSDPTYLTSDSAIQSCIAWGGGYAQAYVIAYNTSTGTRYLPPINSISVIDAAGGNGGANSCAASSFPTYSTRFCKGPLNKITASSCINVFASTGYYWYESRVIWSPLVTACP